MMMLFTVVSLVLIIANADVVIGATSSPYVLKE
jgi:hypothetical protein